MWEAYQLRAEEMIRKLGKPQGKVDVVLDTDTYNEIDDQFALAYLIKSEEKLDLKALYAAPFFNIHSDGPADGMEKSYQEILKILNLMKKDHYEAVTYKGSKTYLPDETTPVDSPAARDLAARALARKEDDPLYVVSIGAITNVASAILMEPSIIRKIVVVWLGGHALHWPHNEEFNVCQDVAAARVVFGCGVPLVQLPCQGVVSAFSTTGPELEYWLKGRNELCSYLVENTVREIELAGQKGCWSRVIWDVTAVAWLLDDTFMADTILHSPIPEYDHKWGFDMTRHLYKYVYSVNRDALFTDLFRKLAR